MAATLGINLEENCFITIPGGTQETFVKDHLSIGKICQMMCCPICCAYVPLASKNRKIEYFRQCGCCKCSWAMNHDGQLAGKVKDVGCCDNGCLFGCCPCLTCGGKIKLMGMENGKGEEKFVFAEELFPCWPIAKACGMWCAPLAMCCLGCQGCCKYCSGTEFKSITQPVFKGGWKRSDGQDPEKIGEFVLTQRFEPVACCFAVPKPLRYYFKPASLEAEKLTTEEMASLAMVLQLYRGMPTPCKCCSPAGFRIPWGLQCTDMGLMTHTSWSTVQDVLKASD